MAYNSPERLTRRHAAFKLQCLATAKLSSNLVCKLTATNCCFSVEFIVAFICKFINFDQLHSKYLCHITTTTTAATTTVVVVVAVILIVDDVVIYSQNYIQVKLLYLKTLSLFLNGSVP